VANPSNFYRELRVNCPLAPEPVMQLAVIDAVRTFTAKTLLWKYTLARISVVADESTYLIDVPDSTNGEFAHTETVKFKIDGAVDTQFTDLNPFGTDDKSGSWEYQTGNAPSEFTIIFGVAEGSYIRLYPIPDEASDSGLEMTVNLKLKLASTTFPDWIDLKYHEIIVAGAKGNLFAQVGMPWYDSTLALYWLNTFDNGIANSKYDKYTANTNRPMQVKMIPF